MNSTNRFALYRLPGPDRHVVPGGYPERSDRIRIVLDAVTAEFGADILRGPKTRADVEEALERVHHREYVERVRGACAENESGYLDSDDTPFSTGTFEAARSVVSLALDAADDIRSGELDRAFIVARPPGHHARAHVSMGFCFFNTVAVVARHLEAAGVGRILILDWDVHHGNGTQETFWHSENVLFVSLHQWPLYPGTGAADEEGSGPGRGTTRNFPLPPGCGDDRYAEVFGGPISDLVDRFRPEFVLVSAGFDPHRDDPLGGMRVTEEGFGEWTRMVRSFAETHAGGRFLSLLEGGYDLKGLAGSAVSHVAELIGGPRNGKSRADGRLPN